jgi:hypothetical protein
MEPAPPGEPPEQQGGLLELFIEFFADLPLKGKVWLAGAIVSDPAYSPESPNWNGVEVFLESPNDKAAINSAMRSDELKDTGIWGNLVYHSGEPNPQEPSILVFDPSAEELPEEEMSMEGEPPAMGAEGMPPEMAAMMGGGPGAV